MRTKADGNITSKYRFNPHLSQYHAILFKAHGEKAKILARGEDLDTVFAGFKKIQYKPQKREPLKPKHKLRLWEDLEGVRDLIEKQ